MKILEHLGKKFEIIDYIKYPPSSTVLKELANKMGIKGKEFIRKRESVFKSFVISFAWSVLKVPDFPAVSTIGF